MKLAVVSHVLPPSSSGGAVVLQRLLRDWDPRDYCLLSRQPEVPATPGSHLRPLSGRRFLLAPERRLKGAGRLRAIGMADLMFQVAQRARRIARIARDERCTAILACSGDLVDLPASALAGTWVGIPFYAYIFDDYVYQWTDRVQRAFARRAERWFAPRTSGVIVPNEFLSAEYARRNAVRPTIVRNAFEPAEGDRADAPWPAGKDGVDVTYTGAVYHANDAAFRNLVQAIQQIDTPRVTLQIYTDQAPAQLAAFGIVGPVAHHPHVEPAESLRIQRRADILFLPLSLDSAIPEVIDTSAPGKMGEYLASGRPILAHAPRSSWVSWYFKTHDCGVVVDTSDPAALADAIRRIARDPGLRARITANARARAGADFSLARSRADFSAVFTAGLPD